jgi:hypothetical protein
MNGRHFAALVLASAVATAGFVAYAVTTAVSPPISGEYNFSQVLPTSRISDSNPDGCGAGVTERVSAPSGPNEAIVFTMAVNASGSQVQYWMNGTAGDANGTLLPDAPVHEAFEDRGMAMSYAVTARGCGPISGVPLTFTALYGPVIFPPPEANPGTAGSS